MPIGESGAIIGASAITRDITDRKSALAQLTSSETHLRSIVESAVDGIIVINARGTIDAFNRGAELLFGYAAAPFEMHDLAALILQACQSTTPGQGQFD